MSTTKYFSLRNKKNIITFRLKKEPYLELCTQLFMENTVS